jgi:S1-C subfamily serine protease
MQSSSKIHTATRALIAIIATSALAQITAIPSLAQAPFDVNEFWNSDDRQALILLIVQGQTAAGISDRNQGTAFFISPDGYALTAAHLFFRGRKRDSQDERLRADKEQALIHGRISSAGAPIWLFELVSIHHVHDLALIRLQDPPKPQKYLKICSSIIPNMGERLFAFGFIAGRGLVAPSGYRLGNLVNDRYPTEIDINPGMSGGPIITSSGRVFGMSLSGVRNPEYQRYNFFLPMQFAHEFIRNSLMNEDCSPGPVVNTETAVESRIVNRTPIILGETTVLFDGFRNYGKSSFSFQKRRIVRWGDESGDIAVSNTQPREPFDPQASFFIPYDAPPYPDNRGSFGGIAEAPIQELINTNDCPSVTNYKYHWFMPEYWTLYCVRTRDGRSYAKISVEDIRSDRISFYWIYQPVLRK